MDIFSSRYLIRRGLYEFIKNNLSGHELGLVVDVGAGRAPYRGLLKCKKYIGIDVERRADVENLIIADINKDIPMDSDSVDVVILTEVLEHLRNPVRAMEELYRVLKPGGRLVLTTPLLWPLHEEPNDFQRFTKYGLGEIFKNSGFKEFKITGYGNYVLSALILAMFPLRKKIFVPVTLVLNCVGLIFLKFRFGSSVFMISNYAIAVK